MSCRECIEKFGLEKRVLWYCPEGKTPDTCGKSKVEMLRKAIEKEQDPVVRDCYLTLLLMELICSWRLMEK